MQSSRIERLLQGGLLGLFAVILAAGPSRADVSVVLGYETRAVGEIEPCG